MEFLNNLPNKDYSQAKVVQKEFFEYWFWFSLINVRYGGGMVGSTNDIIKEDCILLKKIATLEPIEDEVFNRLKIKMDGDDFMDITADKGAASCGIFSFMNHQKKLMELRNNSNIDFSNEINFHHIFPKKYVEDKFGEESKEYRNIDTILNKMIIGKISNIKYGSKSPATYLNEYPINENKKLESTLSNHSIPTPGDMINGKLDNDFLRFIELRKVEFKTDIIDELEKRRQGLIEKYPVI